MLARLRDRARRFWTRRPPRPAVAERLPFWSGLMAAHHDAIIAHVRPFTMTSDERIIALCQAVAHVEAGKVPGAVVECGVWKGGSMMAAALALMRLGSARRLYLFDTFTGMPEPGLLDRDQAGRHAADLLDDSEFVRAYCPLDDVRAAMLGTGYPRDRLAFVPGRVEDTLPAAAPNRIALLRLDTDWYQSTRHELEQLWPRLVPGGVLIVDDYGHWQGAQRAVDDFFAGQSVMMHTIDYTGRLIVKHGS